MANVPSQAASVEPSRPEWFAAFLADRGTRKPSAHTMKAYRQDFDAIATLIAGGDTSVGRCFTHNRYYAAKSARCPTLPAHQQMPAGSGPAGWFDRFLAYHAGSQAFKPGDPLEPAISSL